MAIAGVDGWDVDVAADEESHWAPNWSDVQTDGLKQCWRGRVWCNPPYSDIGPWVRKAWKEWLSGRCSVIAMLLPANRTDQKWWQEDVEPARDGRSLPGQGLEVHFLPGRIRFGHPGNPKGFAVGSPPFGCCLLVWRRP
jgi:hypothetical protein